jgi:hypothetical protein
MYRIFINEGFEEAQTIDEVLNYLRHHTYDCSTSHNKVQEFRDDKKWHTIAEWFGSKPYYELERYIMHEYEQSFFFWEPECNVKQFDDLV